MEYQIVYSSRYINSFEAIEDVENDVKKLIKDGWQPQGGISIVYDTREDEFIAAQAMIKSR